MPGAALAAFRQVFVHSRRRHQLAFSIDPRGEGFSSYFAVHMKIVA
ncbi:MAG: hypothetical protein U5O16_25125 [Rhodococcus sp. (in: high G+C Gram-positive bacteria)]|nr:hypothetical protein [Rhodococcus sp. (in: high G+C Gram-positive bacteria)]